MLEALSGYLLPVSASTKIHALQFALDISTGHLQGATTRRPRSAHPTITLESTSTTLLAQMPSQTRQRATSRSFATRLPELRTIRDTAIRDVLPLALEDLRREYALNLEEETVEWIEDWLGDLGTHQRLIGPLALS